MFTFSESRSRDRSPEDAVGGGGEATGWSCSVPPFFAQAVPFVSISLNPHSLQYPTTCCILSASFPYPSRPQSLWGQGLGLIHSVPPGLHSVLGTQVTVGSIWLLQLSQLLSLCYLPKQYMPLSQYLVHDTHVFLYSFASMVRMQAPWNQSHVKNHPYLECSALLSSKWTEEQMIFFLQSPNLQVFSNGCFPSRSDFGTVPPRGGEVKKQVEGGGLGPGEGSLLELWARISQMSKRPGTDTCGCFLNVKNCLECLLDAIHWTCIYFLFDRLQIRYCFH